tara:strand:+ start:498 stop:890 length:393 start_codon:yes stop_codon:yes gene_type:complete
MAAIKIKLNLESAGLLSSPIKLSESDSIVTTGVVQRVAKTITVEDGSAAVLLAKADFTDADDQALVLLKNTGSTYDLYVEFSANEEAMKLKPGQFAMFPWCTDNTVGNDISVYASNATGTTVEATVIEIT